MGSWQKEKNCQIQAIGIFFILYWIGYLFINWKVALIVFPGLYLVGILLFKVLPNGISFGRNFMKRCKHGKLGGDSLNKCNLCNDEKIKIQKNKEFQIKVSREIEKRNAEKKKKEESIILEFKKLRMEEKQRILELYNLNFENIINVNPYEFESLIAKLYTELGYTVKQTSKSNDGGRDLILRKGEEKVIVECKKYNVNNIIGRPVIQKFHSAIITDKANKGIIVTTSDFNKNVYLHPSVLSGQVELVNRIKLKALLLDKFGIYDPKTFENICLVCGSKYEQRFSRIDYCKNGHKGDFITFEEFLNSTTKK